MSPVIAPPDRIKAPAEVTLVVSVTSAPSSTFSADSSALFDTDPVKPTTAWTASV